MKTAGGKTVRYCHAAPEAQAGVALITAVLIAAVIAVIAMSMAAEQKLDVRRTANVIEGERAYVFALGVESWVGQVLARDKRDNQTDHLGEPWALQLPPITVEGAVVAGRIEDMQGRFNLNNLLDNGKPSPLDVQRFQNLLGVLGLDPNLANAVIDWLDPDADLSFPGGAEDGEYLRAATPYRAANRLMQSPSELLLVHGVTAEIYQQLAALVSALPERTDINVNTAPNDVLMALAPDISAEDAEALIETREENGFASVESFLQHPALAGRAVDVAGLSVASDYFLLDGATQFGRGKMRLYSLLHREGGGARVLARGQGTY